MNIRVIVVLLIGSCFFIFGCGEDDCPEYDIMDVEDAGVTGISFIDENRFPIIGSWWGVPIDSIRVSRADGNEILFNIKENGTIFINLVNKKYDSEAFFERKSMDYYIYFSERDTDTISFEYQFNSYNHDECETVESFIYAKMIYRDSLYYEHTVGIDFGGSSAPGSINLIKK